MQSHQGCRDNSHSRGIYRVVADLAMFAFAAAAPILAFTASVRRFPRAAFSSCKHNQNKRYSMVDVRMPHFPAAVRQERLSVESFS